MGIGTQRPVTASTTATYEYSPFAKLLVSTGPAADSNPIRFSTKGQDETGLCTTTAISTMMPEWRGG